MMDIARIRRRSSEIFWRKVGNVKSFGIEAINLEKPSTFCFRREKIEALYQDLKLERLLYVRSPPCSGKTSLALLTYMHIEKSATEFVPFYFHCFFPKTFEDRFQELYGDSYLTLCENNPATNFIFILDEVQVLFQSEKTILWDLMKARELPKNMHFLMFSYYGERRVLSSLTPPMTLESSQCRNVELLLYDALEFEEVFQIEMVNMLGFSPDELPQFQPFQSMLWQSSRGHPGVIAQVFLKVTDSLTASLQNAEGRSPLEVLVAGLVSRPMLNALFYGRYLLFTDWASLSERVKQDLLLIHEPSEIVSFDTERHAELVKGGVIYVKTDYTIEVDRIFYVCPLLAKVVVDRLRSRGYVSPASDYSLPERIETFIIDAMKLWQQRHFRGSFAIGKKGYLQRKFQMEFFEAARRLLDQDMLDPDVGRVFGSAAMIDFYINSMIQWGIEFLHNRDRLEEHLNRFRKGGKYSCFPLKQHIVVDFIPVANKSPPSPQSSSTAGIGHYMEVFYNPDFSHLEIYYKGNKMGEIYLP